MGVERERVEYGAPVVIGPAPHVVAVVPERVGDDQRGGRRGRGALYRGAGAGDQSASQPGEVGQAGRVETDELGIEDQAVGHRVGEHHQLGELVGARLAGARAERERARVRAYLRAATVELTSSAQRSSRGSSPRP